VNQWLKTHYFVEQALVEPTYSKCKGGLPYWAPSFGGLKGPYQPRSILHSGFLMDDILAFQAFTDKDALLIFIVESQSLKIEG
jgi:hypothetical protein